MTEQQTQTIIIKQLESRGWFVRKVMQLNKNGFPDIMAFKNGKAIFIEVKKKGGRLAPLQQHNIDELRKQGFNAVVMYEPFNSVELRRL